MDYRSFARTNAAIRAAGSVISAILSGVACFKPDALSCTSCDMPMTLTSIYSNLKEIKVKNADDYDREAFREARNDDVVRALDTVNLCAMFTSLAFMIARIAVKLASKKDEDED